MKSNRFFVLMLVVLLPMSGCFDDAVGDAEGADDSSGTTVVNNYNNTTVVTNHYHNNSSQEAPLQHLYFQTNNVSGPVISVNADQVLEIVRASYIVVYDDSYDNDNPKKESAYISDMSCFSVPNEPTPSISAFGIIWKDGGACDYTFSIYEDSDFVGTSYHSIYYRIHTLV